MFALCSRPEEIRKAEKDLRGPRGTSPIPGTKVVSRSLARGIVEGVFSGELFMARCLQVPQDRKEISQMESLIV